MMTKNKLPQKEYRESQIFVSNIHDRLRLYDILAGVNCILLPANLVNVPIGIVTLIATMILVYLLTD